MDVFVTVPLVAVVFWAVALAAISFAKAFVHLLSHLGESGAMPKKLLSVLRDVFYPTTDLNGRVANSGRGLVRAGK